MSLICHLPNRSIVSIIGSDASGLLERLLTQRVDDQKSGECRYTSLLSPQGKVICDFLLLKLEDGFRADVHSDAAEDLIKRLKMFKLRADVQIEALNGLDVFVSLEGEAAPSTADFSYADPRFTGTVQRFASRTAPDEMVSAESYEAIRIARGIPDFGEDFTAADVFPADINMDKNNGVAFKKGCFVGQEVVSRMHRRGNVRRRTLHLTSTSPLARGEAVMAGESTLGEISSSIGQEALARVRTDRLQKALDSDTPITSGDTVLSFSLPDWLKSETETPTS